MKISTKGRYGLRTLIDLAIHQEESPISLGTIAQRQGISLSYLEQIIAILKRAGLVKSIKGALGGYQINCVPKEVTLKYILTILEGELKVVECDDVEVGEESIVQKCVRENLWEMIDFQIVRLLEQLTLEDMIEEYYSKKEGELSYFYSFNI